MPYCLPDLPVKRAAQSRAQTAEQEQTNPDTQQWEQDNSYHRSQSLSTSPSDLDEELSDPATPQPINEDVSADELINSNTAEPLSNEHPNSCNETQASDSCEYLKDAMDNMTDEEDMVVQSVQGRVTMIEAEVEPADVPNETVQMADIKPEPMDDSEVEMDVCSDDSESSCHSRDGNELVIDVDNSVGQSDCRELRVYMTNESGDPPFLCPCGKFKTTTEFHLTVHQNLRKLYPSICGSVTYGATSDSARTE